MIFASSNTLCTPRLSIVLLWTENENRPPTIAQRITITESCCPHAPWTTALVTASPQASRTASATSSGMSQRSRSRWSRARTVGTESLRHGGGGCAVGRPSRPCLAPSTLSEYNDRRRSVQLGGRAGHLQLALRAPSEQVAAGAPGPGAGPELLVGPEGGRGGQHVVQAPGQHRGRPFGDHLGAGDHIVEHHAGHRPAEPALDQGGVDGEGLVGVGHLLADRPAAGLVVDHHQATAAAGVGVGVDPVCAVSITVDRQGAITVASTVLDQGAGTYTIMRQIVAEELQLPVDKIAVRTLDTTTSPPDTGVGGSRATRVYGLATYEAVLKAKKEIQNIAGAKLHCQPDEIRFLHGRVCNAQNTAGIDLIELVAGMESDICVQSLYNSVDKGSVVSICAQVAEVHVDPETGQITVTNFTTAHDTGTILNPLTHQGQIDGGVVMGLGYALIEQLLIEEGKVTTLNFGDSKIPSIRDIPRLKTAVKENPYGLVHIRA